MRDMNRHNSSISNFKSNLRLFGKALIVFIFVVALCFHMMPQYLGDYNAAILDKVSRLKELDEPKIVLLGNSNLAFGIDSSMIEKELGMPVVNMGLHGGCGNAFHEELAKINVQEGDIYVLCHTQYTDNGIINVNPVIIWLTIENHFELWKILRPEDVAVMVKAYPAYLKHCINYWENENGNQLNDTVYSRSAFNEYGDIAIERDELMYEFGTGDTFCPGIDNDTADRINELNSYLQERGAILVVAGYPIGQGEFMADEEEFVQFQNQLQEKLDCAVISDFRDYMFDYSLFYDTGFHLTTEGAKVRTEQLISDLKTYMNR